MRRTLRRIRPRGNRRLPIAALALEAGAFLLIASTIWLNEYLDLPHHFMGAPASPFRPREAIVESGLVLLLGAAVIAFTAALVRQLDSLIVMCAWCHRVRSDRDWASIEEFLQAHRAETTHGVCPECAKRMEVDA
jgi:hypothetical protein